MTCRAAMGAGLQVPRIGQPTVRPARVTSKEHGAALREPRAPWPPPPPSRVPTAGGHTGSSRFPMELSARVEIGAVSSAVFASPEAR